MVGRPSRRLLPVLLLVVFALLFLASLVGRATRSTVVMSPNVVMMIKGGAQLPIRNSSHSDDGDGEGEVLVELPPSPEEKKVHHGQFGFNNR